MNSILARSNPVKRRLVCLASLRGFVKVGEAVPVSYLKDEKPPLIKEDKEYPEWLSSIGKKVGSPISSCIYPRRPSYAPCMMGPSCRASRS
ncbi:hypothetical protein EON64_21130 [archaeon]|nr:MAG: hypothetical protein EON64_21130 [archaeon]